MNNSDNDDPVSKEKNRNGAPKLNLDIAAPALVSVTSPESPEVSQIDNAEIVKRLSDLEATVAGFEAYFSITLMERLQRIVDGKVAASEAVMARASRISRRFLVSLALNVILLGAIIMSPLRESIVAFAAGMITDVRLLLSL